MRHLFDELKRRNVIRVAIAYAVVGWLLIQIANTIEAASGLPDWFDGVVVGFVAIGFPIALLFAWAFEMTPEGVKKTANVSEDTSLTTQTGQKINYLIGGALVLALGFIGWQNLAPGTGSATSPTAQIQAMDASIAVLPFVNMSSDPEQEYFSDGISEEILNVLAQIPELRVAARTSAFSFKSKTIDIPTVAKALGVANVLEGSVRKSGAKVRITAQLIEAKTGFHLWSGTYDRNLSDVFKVQDEISAAIVAALKDKLGLEVLIAPASINAPVNTEAYNAFLLGQHLIRLRTKADIEASIPQFEQAIALDADYAPAHAYLGLAWKLLQGGATTYGTLTLEEMLAKAMPPVEHALMLDPNLPIAHAVMGLVLGAKGQTEQALAQFEEALRLNPSLTNVRVWYSQKLGKIGRESKAFEQIKIAYQLDPLSHLTSDNYANNLRSRRLFDELALVLNRWDQIDPALSASYRGLLFMDQHQAANGVIALFRGVDNAPKDLQMKVNAAFSLLIVGLGDEAIQAWPYSNEGRAIILFGTDYQLTLKMIQQNYQDDPNNLGVLASLAWAYFNTGDQRQAQKLAARHLAKLDPTAKPIANTNLIAVMVAWAKGDQAVMHERLAPLEARVDADLKAGIDTSYVHWQKAQYAFLQGEKDTAYGHAKRALSEGALTPSRLDFPYRHLGWNDIPRFKALRDDYEAYLATERQKLLRVACGDEGFESWKPMPETCALLDQS
jgi:TolB-like protein/lipoprotein NlpI